jgi:hypothetical protein
MQNDLRVVASLDREVAEVVARPTTVEFCSCAVGAGVAQIWSHPGMI